MKDPITLARDPGIDVFVELMGGAGDPAKRAVETALAAGKSVVTANKALLAKHGVALAKLAERHHVALNFEAAVAGGIPIVKTLREGLVGNKLARIYGILNGTCNYILTRMEQEGCRSPIASPMRSGSATPRPIRPSTSRAMTPRRSSRSWPASPSAPRSIRRRSMWRAFRRSRRRICSWADELGYRVKLLGVAVDTGKGIEQRVHPTMVRKDSAIAQVMGVTNAVTVDADAVAAITLVGPGAGGMATASAVVADIGDIARGVRTPPFGRATDRLVTSRKAPMQRHEGGYYIRLLARDKPGTAATIARRLAQQGISLESIVQRHSGPRPQGGDRAGQDGWPGSCHPDYLCDDRGCGAAGSCGGEARSGDIGRAAGHPDREELTAGNLAVRGESRCPRLPSRLTRCSSAFSRSRSCG